VNRDTALSLIGVSKRFGGALALDAASVHIRHGTVHTLLGENGAGKTTLMRVAFGLVSADSGQIVIGGTPAVIRNPAAAIARGLGMVHQHFTNVGRMTVAENVVLGGRGRFDSGAAAAIVREVGERTGLILDPLARAEDLEVGAQQRLEIVKALARGARLLILDEPTAVLAPDEAQTLLRWLRQFADAGGAVVLITHKLSEALGIADDVTVLRHGRTVLTDRVANVEVDAVATAMIGEAAPLPARSARSVTGDVVATVDHLTLVDARGAMALRDASLSVQAGEILGIAGVEGSGQRELLRALAGRMEARGGSVHAPSEVGFIPADRHRDAVVLEFSLGENIALHGAGAARGRMRWNAIRERTTNLVRDFDVRGGSAQTMVRALSGGNQQKLVIARELESKARLVVAENPTRGLDIRAAAAVHGALRRAAEEGAAVVVYSSDLDEVLALATRVIVLHAGIVRDVAMDRVAVARAMLGSA
jgi:ABC-type uncharacterized transport system ATPase subunit